jgi:signal transduction histidine kinase
MIAMENVATLRRWTQAHPRLVDTGIAMVLLVAALTSSSDGPHPGDRSDTGTTVFLALAAVAIAARRRHPLAVWAVTGVLGVLAVLQSDGRLPLALPTFLALYTVGRSVSMRSTVLATAATGVAFAVATAVTQGSWLDERGDFPGMATLALSGAAAAVGVAVRNQQAALTAATARAQQAELTREEEAERRVTDERVRIARELHDVLAHHISVINVQAGVARHLMDSRPEQARTALGLVREASKTVLSEMSAVVGLLRTQEEDAPTEPAPGLGRIGALIESVRQAGLQLTWSSTGDPYELPPINDLTAYRVVQESLTNAVKYGDGTADLIVDHGPEVVTIDVRNPVGATRPRSSGSGHGLIGMRERVEAVRGRLVTGPSADGTFAVHAEIPRGAA